MRLIGSPRKPASHARISNSEAILEAHLREVLFGSGTEGWRKNYELRYEGTQMQRRVPAERLQLADSPPPDRDQLQQTANRLLQRECGLSSLHAHYRQSEGQPAEIVLSVPYHEFHQHLAPRLGEKDAGALSGNIEPLAWRKRVQTQDSGRVNER